MNANAALQAHESLAEQERQEAAELAPEIVRDLNEMGDGDDLSPVQRAAKDALNDWAARNVRDTVVEPLLAIADKLPAELASISEMFSAMVERKAEIARKAAEDIAAVDAQMLRTLNQVLRRLAVTENLLNMERQTTVNLRDAAEDRANVIRAALAGIDDATDQALIAKRATADYERNYREQYEHAPEPPDDDGGSRAPVTQRDRELVDAVDFETAQLREYFARPKEPIPAPQPSLRSRVMTVGKAMLNPEQFIRRNASPPFRAA